MKKTLIILGSIGLVLFTIYSYVVGKYNTMVTINESVETAWSKVESKYQRRNDLIPNLVNTVKGYATHENETFEDIVKARAEATSVKINIEDASKMAEYYSKQSGISQSLSRLLLLQENYPELKADKGFLELQTQLEGTENRISTERDRYNDEVKEFNIYIKKFPNSVFAGLFHFSEKAFFKADDGADKAPEVKF